MPGVQKPHCSALRSTNAACRSAISPVSARPSMVTTSAPSACTASIRQPRTTTPSTRTEQAPQMPCSQPRCAAGEAQLDAQEIDQVLAHRHRARHALAVDGERYGHGLLLAHAAARPFRRRGSSARRVSTRCRCRRILALPCGLDIGSRSSARAAAAASPAAPSSRLPTNGCERTCGERRPVLAGEVGEPRRPPRRRPRSPDGRRRRRWRNRRAGARAPGTPRRSRRSCTGISASTSSSSGLRAVS